MHRTRPGVAAFARRAFCRGALVLPLVCAAGCPQTAAPPSAPLTYDPTAMAPESSGRQNVDLAAAKQRIVPYDVEGGGTVYAIRDLLAAAGRITSPRERGEAQFLAAAATLDLVLYSDITADERPLGGLRDAWNADGRDGIVAAVDTVLQGIGGSFLPAAEQNGRKLAAALRVRERPADFDTAALNAMAMSNGPLSFAARIVLLDVHAGLLARAATEGSPAFLAAAPGLAPGLPEPAGEVFAGLDDRSKATATVLAFAQTNAAEVRAAAADEPLVALLGAWLDLHRLDAAPLSFVRPLSLADLPGGDAGQGSAPFAGHAPAARLFVHVATGELTVGLADQVVVSGGNVALDHVALGGEAGARVVCAVPDPWPTPPRRFACLQGALAAGLAASPGNARLLVVGAASVPLGVLSATLREAVAAGLTAIEAGGRGPDGLLTSFRLSFSEERDAASGPGTVRIAPGGFYVGKRGDLVQIPRASGAFDFAGLLRAATGREPPFVLTPAKETTYATFLGALSALADLAASAGVTVTLLPPE
jgi:hypothetical protein